MGVEVVVALIPPLCTLEPVCANQIVHKSLKFSASSTLMTASGDLANGGGLDAQPRQSTPRNPPSRPCQPPCAPHPYRGPRIRIQFRYLRGRWKTVREAHLGLCCP